MAETDPTDLAEYPAPPPEPIGKVWPPRDRLGRKLPHRLNWAVLGKAVPGVFISGQFATVVPDDYWSRDEADDETPVAVVSCPCGEAPAVPLGNSKSCNCDRIFLYLGSEVRVHRPPTA